MILYTRLTSRYRIGSYIIRRITFPPIIILVFKLLGQFINAEVQSALGRADAVVKTANAVYVFEFKLNGTAEEALAQIDNRGYLIPYTTNGCHIVKIGAEFTKEERNLSRWLVEEEG